MRELTNADPQLTVPERFTLEWLADSLFLSNMAPHYPVAHGWYEQETVGSFCEETRRASSVFGGRIGIAGERSSALLTTSNVRGSWTASRAHGGLARSSEGAREPVFV